MNRTGRIILGVVAVGVIAAVVGLVWFFTQGGGEASQDISQAVSTLARESTPEATADAVAAGSASGVAADDIAAVGALVFAIVPDDSEARFIIDEILSGQPKEVVGTTKQVGGEMLIDFENPSASQIGEIVVNVRTLATDAATRDRALRGMILGTDDPANEFARFLPTALNGLPDTIAFGTPFDLTIDGDLTLKNTTRPVTFTATITPISAERIEGLATLIIDYAEDFGITIPMLPPIVASVEDTVRLEIEFVAAPVAE